jgi:hypothetical protein
LTTVALRRASRIGASQHLAERERLDEIVVASCAEAAHAIVDFTKSAQD